MRIAIDAMSGDLGSAPVVEACRHFANEHKDATLVVVGKQEELESLKILATELDCRELEARCVSAMEAMEEVHSL